MSLLWENGDRVLWEDGGLILSEKSQFTGLQWPGDGLVRRMLFWNNPPPIYDMTYLFRVLPTMKETEVNPRYWTTFFWGNNGDFFWFPTSPRARSYYGAHPYPGGGAGAPFGVPQMWEISVAEQDELGPAIESGKWHMQAFRAWRESASLTHHEFYYDLPDLTKVITKTVNDPQWGVDVPPSPAIVMGQAPDLNGQSWGGYNGWEEYKGVIRGIQIFRGLLTIDECIQEHLNPGSTANGNVLVWYRNINPSPEDVTDKSGQGNHPQWDGTTALLWSGAPPVLHKGPWNSGTYPIPEAQVEGDMVKFSVDVTDHTDPTSLIGLSYEFSFDGVNFPEKGFAVFQGGPIKQTDLAGNPKPRTGPFISTHEVTVKEGQDRRVRGNVIIAGQTNTEVDVS